MAVNAAADPLPANPAPLNQLNNQSAQALRQITAMILYPPGALHAIPSTGDGAASSISSKLSSSLLQERQRQEFIGATENQTPPYPGPEVRRDWMQ